MLSSGIASLIWSILVLLFSACLKGETTNTSAPDSFKTFCTSSQFSNSVVTIVLPALIVPTAAEMYSREWFTSDQNKTFSPVMPCSVR